MMAMSSVLYHVTICFDKHFKAAKILAIEKYDNAKTNDNAIMFTIYTLHCS